MAQYTKAVTQSDFEQQVLKADVPVLVDFWAPWCGPCVSSGPSLRNLLSSMKVKQLSLR